MHAWFLIVLNLLFPLRLLLISLTSIRSYTDASTASFTFYRLLIDIIDLNLNIIVIIDIFKR